MGFAAPVFEATLRKQLVMPRPTDWLVCVERSVGLLSFVCPSSEGAI